MTSREERLERVYAELERKNEVRKQATVRRGPVSLIAVCLGVALVVGVVAAVDLRRLTTPTGTAMAFTGAAVFGDCTAFARFTVERRDGAPEDDESRCRSLRAASEEARERPADVEIEVLDVATGGPDTAAVLVSVQRPGASRREVTVALERRDGDWQVRLTEALCEAVPCP